jgi:predicted acylesterase/phospholipase RssA
MNGKIAFVISGGGARGTAYIGDIEELQNNGYELQQHRRRL